MGLINQIRGMSVTELAKELVPYPSLQPLFETLTGEAAETLSSLLIKYADEGETALLELGRQLKEVHYTSWEEGASLWVDANKTRRRWSPYPQLSQLLDRCKTDETVRSTTARLIEGLKNAPEVRIQTQKDQENSVEFLSSRFSHFSFRKEGDFILAGLKTLSENRFERSFTASSPDRQRIVTAIVNRVAKGVFDAIQIVESCWSDIELLERTFPVEGCRDLFSRYLVELSNGEKISFVEALYHVPLSEVGQEGVAALIEHTFDVAPILREEFVKKWYAKYLENKKTAGGQAASWLPFNPFASKAAVSLPNAQEIWSEVCKEKANSNAAFLAILERVLSNEGAHSAKKEAAVNAELISELESLGIVSFVKEEQERFVFYRGGFLSSLEEKKNIRFLSLFQALSEVRKNLFSLLRSRLESDMIPIAQEKERFDYTAYYIILLEFFAKHSGWEILCKQFNVDPWDPALTDEEAFLVLKALLTADADRVSFVSFRAVVEELRAHLERSEKIEDGDVAQEQATKVEQELVELAQVEVPLHLLLFGEERKSIREKLLLLPLQERAATAEILASERFEKIFKQDYLDILSRVLAAPFDERASLLQVERFLWLYGATSWIKDFEKILEKFSIFEKKEICHIFKEKLSASPDYAMDSLLVDLNKIPAQFMISYLRLRFSSARTVHTDLFREVVIDLIKLRIPREVLLATQYVKGVVKGFSMSGHDLASKLVGIMIGSDEAGTFDLSLLVPKDFSLIENTSLQHLLDRLLDARFLQSYKIEGSNLFYERSKEIAANTKEDVGGEDYITWGRRLGLSDRVLGPFTFVPAPSRLGILAKVAGKTRERRDAVFESECSKVLEANAKKVASLVGALYGDKSKLNLAQKEQVRLRVNADRFKECASLFVDVLEKLEAEEIVSIVEQCQGLEGAAIKSLLESVLDSYHWRSFNVPEELLQAISLGTPISKTNLLLFSGRGKEVDVEVLLAYLERERLIDGCRYSEDKQFITFVKPDFKSEVTCLDPGKEVIAAIKDEDYETFGRELVEVLNFLKGELAIQALGALRAAPDLRIRQELLENLKEDNYWKQIIYGKELLEKLESGEKLTPVLIRNLSNIRSVADVEPLLMRLSGAGYIGGFSKDQEGNYHIVTVKSVLEKIFGDIDLPHALLRGKGDLLIEAAKEFSREEILEAAQKNTREDIQRYLDERRELNFWGRYKPPEALLSFLRQRRTFSKDEIVSVSEIRKISRVDDLIRYLSAEKIIKNGSWKGRIYQFEAENGLYPIDNSYLTDLLEKLMPSKPANQFFFRQALFALLSDGGDFWRSLISLRKGGIKTQVRALPYFKQCPEDLDLVSNQEALTLLGFLSNKPVAEIPQHIVSVLCCFPTVFWESIYSLLSSASQQQLDKFKEEKVQLQAIAREVAVLNPPGTSLSHVSNAPQWLIGIVFSESPPRVDMSKGMLSGLFGSAVNQATFDNLMVTGIIAGYEVSGGVVSFDPLRPDARLALRRLASKMEDDEKKEFLKLFNWTTLSKLEQKTYLRLAELAAKKPRQIRPYYVAEWAQLYRPSGYVFAGVDPDDKEVYSLAILQALKDKVKGDLPLTAEKLIKLLLENANLNLDFGDDERRIVNELEEWGVISRGGTRATPTSTLEIGSASDLGIPQEMEPFPEETGRDSMPVETKRVIEEQIHDFTTLGINQELASLAELLESPQKAELFESLDKMEEEKREEFFLKSALEYLGIQI